MPPPDCSQRFNYEINVRVLIPIRLLINYLIANRLLDEDNEEHINAFGAIIQPVMQVGLDLLRDAWNNVRAPAIEPCNVYSYSHTWLV